MSKQAILESVVQDLKKEDLPEIRDWQWGGASKVGAPGGQVLETSADNV